MVDNWFHNNTAIEAGCSIIQIRLCCTALHPHMPLLCSPLCCAPACLTHYSAQFQRKAVLKLLWFWDRGDVALTEAIYNLFLISSWSWGLKFFQFKSWIVEFIIASELLYNNERLAKGASNTSNDRPTKCPPKLKLSFAEKAGKRLASFMLPALGCCQWEMSASTERCYSQVHDTELSSSQNCYV